MPRAKKKELKVCFDTNMLHTQVASDLLRKQVADLLSLPLNDPNLAVKWLIPQMVLEERQYQMQQKAKDLLPSLAKLERVIGHGLGITAEIVNDRIVSTIKMQLAQYGLHVLTLDANEVDWGRVVTASVNREAPFEAGDKEKGFRDAVIIETFMQEVKRSPRTSASCILAMVSEDVLLREAVRLRTAGILNVRILADLDELNGLINTLASEVSEEYVKEMQGKAAPLFFGTPDDKTTLYHTWEIRKSIRAAYAHLLDQKPAGVNRIVEAGVFVQTTPQFLSKSGPVLNWQSRIRVKQDLYGPTTEIESPNMLLARLREGGGLLKAASASEAEAPLSTRDLIFQVKWSTRVNAQKKLSAPKFEGIVEDVVAPSAETNGGV